MNKTTWAAFSAARDRYRDYVETLRREFPRLKKLQQQLVDSRTGPPYTVERPLVYNLALDEVGPQDNIRLILVADNPGRREQVTGRYLVGPSGKIAEGFFRNTPDLGIDLRSNVLILNKTPVHTPRTAELGELCRLGGPKFAEKLAATQRFMAALLLEFHAALSGGCPAGSSTYRKPVPVWITGYSEMKKGGIFQVYTDALQEIYAQAAGGLR
ncbi:MAG: uracil-DNA glycosylase family protein, partial [Treponema sp.]|nr:uracil-DNA glycosylase family protein [Treponema sp.]